MNRQLVLAINLVFAIIVFQAVNSPSAYPHSEKKEPLNLAWVKADIDAVAALLKLMPVENQNVEVLKKELNGFWSVNDDTLGGDHLKQGSESRCARNYLCRMLLE